MATEFEEDLPNEFEQDLPAVFKQDLPAEFNQDLPAQELLEALTHDPTPAPYEAYRARGKKRDSRPWQPPRAVFSKREKLDEQLIYCRRAIQHFEKLKNESDHDQLPVLPGGFWKAWQLIRLQENRRKKSASARRGLTAWYGRRIATRRQLWRSKYPGLVRSQRFARQAAPPRLKSPESSIPKRFDNHVLKAYRMWLTSGQRKPGPKLPPKQNTNKSPTSAAGNLQPLVQPSVPHSDPPQSQVAAKRAKYARPRANTGGKTASEPFHHVNQLGPWEEGQLPPPGTVWRSKHAQNIVVYGIDGIPSFEVTLGNLGSVWLPKLIRRQGAGNETWFEPQKTGYVTSQAVMVNYIAKTQQPAGFPAAMTIKLPHLEAEGKQADMFRNENRILELLDMSGSSHFPRLAGASGSNGQLVALKAMNGVQIRDGEPAAQTLEKMLPLVQASPLSHLWTLVECLAKALCVMAVGAEDPDDYVEGWCQIVHLDLTPETVYIRGAGAEHSCIDAVQGFNENWMIGDFGTAIIVPKDANQKKKFRDQELKHAFFAKMGRADIPEQTRTTSLPEAHRAGDAIAANYGSWSNVYQLGRLLRQVAPESRLRLAPSQERYRPILEAVLTAWTAGSEQDGFKELPFEEKFRRLRQQAKASPKEDVARLRLHRLIDWCLQADPAARPTVVEVLLEASAGLGEAGGLTGCAEVVKPTSYTEAGQQRLRAAYRAGTALGQ